MTKPEMTNDQRAARGAKIINARIDWEPGLGAFEAACDVITDILHAYCSADELEAEELLRRAKMHFVAECDEAEEDDENPEFCECGREWNACARREASEHCEDRDTYLRRGEARFNAETKEGRTDGTV